jgi:hypothetical protein
MGFRAGTARLKARPDTNLGKNPLRCGRGDRVNRANRIL